MSVVLDASALLAFLLEETGADIVKNKITGSFISAINLNETVIHFVRKGHDAPLIQSWILGLDMMVMPFDEVQSLVAAQLYPISKPYGLSMADRACLALGISQNMPVMTADRVWGQLDIEAQVQLIR